MSDCAKFFGNDKKYHRVQRLQPNTTVWINQGQPSRESESASTGLHNIRGLYRVAACDDLNATTHCIYSAGILMPFIRDISEVAETETLKLAVGGDKVANVSKNEPLLGLMQFNVYTMITQVSVLGLDLPGMIEPVHASDPSLSTVEHGIPGKVAVQYYDCSRPKPAIDSVLCLLID